MIPEGVTLLEKVLAGPLIAAAELPTPPDALRKPPKAGKASNAEALIFEDGMLPGTQGDVIF